MTCTYKDLGEGWPEDSGVKVEALVDLGLDLDVIGEEVGVLSPLLCDVSQNGTALVEDKVAINKCGHIVLRIQLEKVAS